MVSVKNLDFQRTIDDEVGIRNMKDFLCFSGSVFLVEAVRKSLACMHYFASTMRQSRYIHHTHCDTVHFHTRNLLPKGDSSRIEDCISHEGILKERGVNE
jgi:hypothetical protein